MFSAIEGQEPDTHRAAEAERMRGLLRRVARSDKAAFTELYDTSSARIYGLVRAVLRDPGFSEETTQEVFLQIWRTAGSFDPERGSPTAWMMTIAHRRAVDRVRSEQSGSDRESQYGAKLHHIAHDEVVEAVTQRLEAETVAAGLSSLTDTQLESVHLAYYGGLTYREVADRLGVPVATVKTRIRDGLIKLSKCLGVARDGRQR